MPKFNEITSDIILAGALEASEAVIADYATIKKNFAEDLEGDGYFSEYHLNQLSEYMVAAKVAKVLIRIIGIRKETHTSPEAVDSIRKYVEEKIVLGTYQLDAEDSVGKSSMAHCEHMIFGRIARYFRGASNTLQFV